MPQKHGANFRNVEASESNLARDLKKKFFIDAPNRIFMKGVGFPSSLSALKIFFFFFFLKISIGFSLFNVL